LKSVVVAAGTVTLPWTIRNAFGDDLEDVPQEDGSAFFPQSIATGDPKN
jgi:hypothetical protein